jgi:hypothetical protein
MQSLNWQLIEVDFWSPLSPTFKPSRVPLAGGMQRQAHKVRHGHQRFSGIEKAIADFNAAPRKSIIIVGVVRMSGILLVNEDSTLQRKLTVELLNRNVPLIHQTRYRFVQALDFV